jgi:hypothetical protein
MSPKNGKLNYQFPNPPNISRSSSNKNGEFSLISVFGRDYPGMSNIKTMFGPNEEWDKRIVGHRPFVSIEEIQNFIIFCRNHKIPRSHLTIRDHVPMILTDDAQNLTNQEYLEVELKNKLQPFIDNLRQILHLGVSDSEDNSQQAHAELINNLVNSQNEDKREKIQTHTAPTHAHTHTQVQVPKQGQSMKLKTQLPVVNKIPMNEIVTENGKKFKTHIPSSHFENTMVEVKVFNNDPTEFEKNHTVNYNLNLNLPPSTTELKLQSEFEIENSIENFEALLNKKIFATNKNNIDINGNNSNDAQEINSNNIDLNSNNNTINKKKKKKNKKKKQQIQQIDDNDSGTKLKNLENKNDEKEKEKKIYTNTELLKLPEQWRTDKVYWVVQFISNDVNNEKFKEPIIISRGFFKSELDVKEYKTKYFEYYNQHRQSLTPDSTDQEILESIIGHYDLVVLSVDESRPAWYSRNHAVELKREDHDQLGKELDVILREEKNRKYTNHATKKFGSNILNSNNTKGNDMDDNSTNNSLSNKLKTKIQVMKDKRSI